MNSLDPWTLALEGTQLIEASAGTGKTYTLTTLYVRLLVEKNLLPSEILVVTYTQAATAELRERVRARIQEALAMGESVGDFSKAIDENSELDEELRTLARLACVTGERNGGVNPLRRALQEFDEAAIFTIHGFCQRTLQENAFESGVAFDAELVEEEETLQRTLANDLWARIVEMESPDFVEWLRGGAGRRWKFEPDELRQSILRELGADEEMPILPEVAATDEDSEWETNAADLRSKFEGIWLRWANGWLARREDVISILLGDHDLKKGSYKRETIELKWIPQLNRIAAAIEETGDARSMSAVELPSWWKNLTPEGLEKALKKNGRPVEDPFFELCGEVSHAVGSLDEVRRARALSMRLRFVALAREEAKKRREEKHLLFFDDLLTELRGALRPPEGDRLVEVLRARYRFALIDEFQDTDPVQYEIFRRVWHEGQVGDGTSGLFLIGDPKQAIYSFRGADVFTYLDAREDASGGVHGLGVNWRSSGGLIATVNALFAGPHRAFGLDAIEFRPVESRPEVVPALSIPGRSEAGFRVLMVDREGVEELFGEPAKKALPTRFGRTKVMQAFARDVADLLDAGGEIEGRPITPSDIAVLCRRKIELLQARRALEALGIPCVDRGDSDVFDSREAWELLSVLRAFLRSSDPSLLRSALSTGAHGMDAYQIRGLADDGGEIALVGERFAEYGRIWLQSGFGLAFETWRRRESVTERLLGLQDGERRLTNWLHLAELLQRVENDRGLSRAAMVAWLERAIASVEARGEVGSEASLLRLERDDQAVSLVTLHRSKGLEYPIVYLPSLWEDSASRTASEETAKDATKAKPPIRFYDESSGKRTLDLGGPDYAEHVSRGKEEARSEQFRLLYVGLTRAKVQCVVVWGALGTSYSKTPLAWLLHARAWEAEGKDQAGSPAALKKWGDEEWIAAWDAIGKEAKGADGTSAFGDPISVDRLQFEPRGRWRAPELRVKPIEFEKPRRRLGRPFLTTSFSALVRNAHFSSQLMAGPQVTGRDRDDRVGEIIEEREERPNLAASMHEFPRGADAGTLLHDVLERVSFSNFDPDEVREHAIQALGKSGLVGDHLVDQILHVVESVARTPLRTVPDSFCLADLPKGQQIPEIEFTLAAPGNEEQARFAPTSLAAVLAEAEEGSPFSCYAGRVGQMDWRELKGYLRGFIDSVFFDGERYYLIDYKSNFLGVRQADYHPDRLMQPMIDHDYVLQYLIYSIALNRHLERRLSGYDYERHFGGAYYLFLRGLAESHEPRSGVFFDRPAKEMIERASALLGEAGNASYD